MLQILQSIKRVVTLIALDVYDRLQGQSHLSHLARVVEHTGQGDSFTFEWWTAFPELRQWIGQRKTQEAFQGSIKGTIEPYEITYGLDRKYLELGDPLTSAAVQEMGPKMTEAFLVGQERLAYEVLLTNPVSYDGQDFFDTDHTHPNGKSYSNLLEIGTDVPNRATANQPTALEVRKELEKAEERLLENTVVRNRLVDAGEVQESIRVIARSSAVFSAFNALLKEDRFPGGEINRYKGSFSLSRDFNPPAGLENSYDVISALPGGPRPVVFVKAKDPSGVDFDESADFRDREIMFGMDGLYGVAPGFPQTALRVQ